MRVSPRPESSLISFSSIRWCGRVFPTHSPFTQQPKQTHTARHLHVEQQIWDEAPREVTDTPELPKPPTRG